MTDTEIDHESEARAAAEKRYPSLEPEKDAYTGYPPSALRYYEQGAYIAGYIAGSNRPTGETHDEDTLRKVYDALDIVGVRGIGAQEAVNAMQNAGILFRERVPEFDRTAEHSRAEEPAAADECEALIMTLYADGMADNLHEPVRRNVVERWADAILAAGWRKHD